MTKKNWIVRVMEGNDYDDRKKNYATLADAEKAAKQRVVSQHQDYGVYELVAVANNPTPDVEIVAVTE